MNIPLSGPDITDMEKKYVSEVLEGVLSIGPRIEKFEEMVAEYAGVKYAVAVNSGTAALHLIVRSLGIGNGDEVITTPFGHPIDIETLNQIARRHNLHIIEDSCEALGSSYKNSKCGSRADAGAYAFYPNKQITTAEGGVIITNNKMINDLSRSMRNQGRENNKLWLSHVRLGYNYRLSELHAALGIAQMMRIKEIISRRKKVASFYNDALNQLSMISLPKVDDEIIQNGWFVYVIRLNEMDNVVLDLIMPQVHNNSDSMIERSKFIWRHKERKEKFCKICRDVYRKRNQLMDFLRKRNIECKPYFTPIHLQKFYRDEFGYKEGNFPITEYVSSGTVALPFFSALKLEQVQYIAGTLSTFFSVR